MGLKRRAWRSGELRLNLPARAKNKLHRFRTALAV